MTRARLAALATAALVPAAVLAGCADSGYRYVKNSSDGAYFKVPDSWELFRVEEDDTAPTDRPEALDLGGEAPWIVVFDGSPEPALSHAQEAAPDHPVGLAQVFPLSSGERDGISLAGVRSLALDGEADPLELISQGNPAIEPIAYEDITTDAGLRGSRIVFNQQLSDGTWITVDHTALLDAATQRLYRFVVRCSSTCFKAHESEIDAVVASWRIEKDG